MKILQAFLKKFSSHAILLLMVSVLTGCPKTSDIDNESGTSTDQTQQYLNYARKSNGTKRTDWLLLASESLLIQKRTDKALAVLNTVDNNELTDKSFQLYHLLMAQALYSAERSDQAFDQYAQITQPDLLKKYQQISFYRNYADLLSVLMRHYDSALQRIALSAFLSDPLDVEENRELLWQSLMMVNNLSIYQNSLNSLLVSGWLELANLAKDNANQPDELLRRLEIWRSRYFEHPAYKGMPIDIAHAESARSYKPQRIALLLPEKGSLANSAHQIREGFLTAIYHISIELRPEVVFYDSSKSSDILALYQQAIDEGASFVIGPLRRESVKKLASREHFPVPVISINRLTEDLVLPENFYQFGLPVEDEARQAAIRAWQDGLSKAIVLVPSGNVGERTRIAFTEQFERLGGEIQQVISFNSDKDYSKAVQELLGVDKSLGRLKRLQNVLGMTLKHEARRRQDTDFLFFKASVQQARRIKPFIDFYYAHDLPLYSTSSIYSGKEELVLDRDLENVSFCDIPWLLSDQIDIVNYKKQISSIWPNSTQSRSARLFALGYDLFTLIPELNRLRNFPQYQKNGLSGKLTVNGSGHVQRQLSWAKFVNGKTVQLEQAIQ
ncbi:MAG: hypothetical protein GY829_07875 [Gammaproteobacteria bacterium]|nr:hypothetical protein [Gammaproteobacteria bacterium]